MDSLSPDQSPAPIQKERTEAEISNELDSLIGEYKHGVQLQLALKDRIEALLKEQEQKAAMQERAIKVAFEAAQKNLAEKREKSNTVREELKQAHQPLFKGTKTDNGKFRDIHEGIRYEGWDVPITRKAEEDEPEAAAEDDDFLTALANKKKSARLPVVCKLSYSNTAWITNDLLRYQSSVYKSLGFHDGVRHHVDVQSFCLHHR
jgi:hypothetical protein